jgi:hypothetical protein
MNKATIGTMVVSAWVLAAGAGWSEEPAAAGEETKVVILPPHPGPHDAPVEMRMPRPKPLDTTPRRISAKGAPAWAGNSRDDSPLRTSRVLSAVTGRARLKLADGSERELVPGDVVGFDTVQSVDTNQILLNRSASAPGGDAIVILALKGDGTTELSVYLTRDPNPMPIPQPLAKLPRR